ncbi:MAG: RsbRD N-terminal domain-containing protein [Caldimicrobium sp.]
MEFKDFLQLKKSEILELWINKFWEDFGESAYYFKKEIDPFTNPFGYHIRECFEKVLNSLCGDINWEEMEETLQKLAQIRAVQESLPSKASKMFLILKGIIRDRIGEEILNKFGISHLLDLEDRINAFMLRYFDFYQSFRERLYELKVEEFKRNNYLLLKRAGLINESSEFTLKDEAIQHKKH